LKQTPRQFQRQVSKSPSRQGGDKGLRMPLFETLKLAWADQDIRQRLLFILMVFAVFALGVHIPVPILGFKAETIEALVKKNPFFDLIDTFGGGGLKRISILALGLNPYITSSIIMQILTATTPKWKQELQEGGEYAKAQQNKRTRLLTLALCVFQGLGFLQMMGPAFANIDVLAKITTILFWTTGSMFILWLGEQVSEKGIGNGISLMIFAGIIISLPGMIQRIIDGIQNGIVHPLQIALLVAIFIATTWFVVTFTIAQRRIPIQHMRRQMGAKLGGGSTSYLPLSLNLAGVIPIIFAVSLVYMPAQFASMFPQDSFMQTTLATVGNFLRPDFSRLEGIVGCFFYIMLIFFFTYFYTAIQYNVEDIANNLKRGGSFIPGIRPGKQTKDFLDGVISRLTIVGALFLALIALTQYFVPLIVSGIPNIGLLFGTSLLIMVSVALETMRQIEANILMKQYGQQG
jgi:preprotein translocase subunit SecY